MVAVKWKMVGTSHSGEGDNRGGDPHDHLHTHSDHGDHHGHCGHHGDIMVAVNWKMVGRVR